LDRNKIFTILDAALAEVVWCAAFIAIKIALREGQPLTVIWLWELSFSASPSRCENRSQQ